MQNAENIHEMFQPDQETMMQMVGHLFADQTHGLVELAWTDPMQGAPCHAQLFSLDAIDELTERAAELNAERRNIYIGAALRKDTTAPFGRTNTEDFFAATALWSDLDEPGDTLRAAELCKQLGVRPSLAVITGRHPHERGQIWWRLDQPLEDAVRVKALLGRIQKTLGGDAAVCDPVRIMRLAGSIAWPVKSGREVEHTQIIRVDQTIYGLERLGSAFPETAHTGNGSDTDFEDFFGGDIEALIAAARTPGTRHKSKLRLVAHWVMRGCNDAEITLMGEGIGHQDEKTRQTFLKMISTARAKWNTPNQNHKVADPQAAPQNAGAIDPEKVAWRWYPYIPAAQLSLIAGYGGGGKGLLCVDFAARLTKGACWPFSEQSGQAASVLWCEAEDPRASVLVPRLIAAEADRNRVHFVNPRELAVLNLKTFVQEQALGLIVLSPLVSFLNGLKDVVGELGVRKTLETLQEAIENTRCAAVGICHLNKKSDLPAIDRVLGSVAFVNFVRSVLLIAKDKELEGVNRLVHGKYNLSVKGPDLLYQPRHVGDDLTDQFVKIEWSQPDSDVDAEKLFAGKKSEADSKARDWLVAYLEKFGETPSSIVIDAAEKEGFTKAAIEKARQREKRCKTRKADFVLGWVWWVE